MPLNRDGWDGYPADRSEIGDHLLAGGIEDVTVLTGDVHHFAAGDCDHHRQHHRRGVRHRVRRRRDHVRLPRPAVRVLRRGIAGDEPAPGLPALRPARLRRDGAEPGGGRWSSTARPSRSSRRRARSRRSRASASRAAAPTSRRSRARTCRSGCDARSGPPRARPVSAWAAARRCAGTRRAPGCPSPGSAAAASAGRPGSAPPSTS